MANRLVDLTGAVFARLSVIENSGADHRGKRLWRCLCLCGNERVTTADKLRERSLAAAFAATAPATRLPQPSQHW